MNVKAYFCYEAKLIKTYYVYYDDDNKNDMYL